jgi:hypothetical protein
MSRSKSVSVKRNDPYLPFRAIPCGQPRLISTASQSFSTYCAAFRRVLASEYKMTLKWGHAGKKWIQIFRANKKIMLSYLWVISTKLYEERSVPLANLKRRFAVFFTFGKNSRVKHGRIA